MGLIAAVSLSTKKKKKKKRRGGEINIFLLVFFFTALCSCVCFISVITLVGVVLSFLSGYGTNTHTISGLLSYWRYRVTVQPRTVKGSSPSNTSDTTRTKESGKFQ